MLIRITKQCIYILSIGIHYLFHLASIVYLCPTNWTTIQPHTTVPTNNSMETRLEDDLHILVVADLTERIHVITNLFFLSLLSLRNEAETYPYDEEKYRNPFKESFAILV